MDWEGGEMGSQPQSDGTRSSQEPLKSTWIQNHQTLAPYSLRSAFQAPLRLSCRVCAPFRAAIIHAASRLLRHGIPDGSSRFSHAFNFAVRVPVQFWDCIVPRRSYRHSSLAAHHSASFIRDNLHTIGVLMIRESAPEGDGMRSPLQPAGEAKTPARVIERLSNDWPLGAPASRPHV
jgi:hypothetical protein